MVAQGMALNAANPNVMIKMPGTKEGIAGIRILAAKGIPTNATLVFTIPQILSVAEAVQGGHAEAVAKGVDTSRWRAVCTMMLGRYEDVPEFAAQCQAKGFELTESDKRWSGIAIFKKACRLFEERAYPLKMLAASMRVGPTVDGRLRVWHVEKLAGHDAILTIFPNIYEAWLAHYTPEEIVSHADEGVPEEVVERLLQVEYFRQGYLEGGLDPDDYISHPAVIATGNSFAEATRELEMYVDQRMKAVQK
jgi:transaldolase